LPQLSYCASVWGNKSIKEIETLQKASVRVLAGEKPKSHTDPIFAKLGILKIADIVKQQHHIDGFNAFHGRLPKSLNEVIYRTSTTHDHKTRASVNCLSTSSLSCKSILKKTVAEWNTFSSQISCLEISTATLKAKSKDEILKGYEKFSCSDQACYCCNEIRLLQDTLPVTKNLS
jgi:hypothetical protein